MADTYFDDLTRSLTGPSRRSFLAALGTAIGAALFGVDAEEALAKRTKRRHSKRAKHTQAKREHAKTRRRASHDRLEAEGRKNKKKNKKKSKKRSAAAAPPAESGSTSSPSCVPQCTSNACGAPNGCGGTCPSGSCPGGQVCQQGHCVLSCDAGFTLCGSQCVDTQMHASHCGGCNQPCTVEAPSTCGTNGLCAGGVCQWYGQETVCWPESCLDTVTSSLPSICGGTGSPCATPIPVDCRPGQCDFEYGSRCRDGCFEHTDCSSDGWCDDGQCRFKRGNGQPCSASAPQMCASGFCVDGVCCESACNAPPNAQRTCAGGTCAFTCEAGWDDCDGNPTNGCEADLNSNDDHCGTCRNRCPSTNCGDASEPRFWACVNGNCECLM